MKGENVANEMKLSETAKGYALMLEEQSIFALEKNKEEIVAQGRAVVKPLIELLEYQVKNKEEINAKTMSATIEVLGKIADKTAVSILKNILNDEMLNENCRSSAINALGEITKKANDQKLAREVVSLLEGAGGSRKISTYAQYAIEEIRKVYPDLNKHSADAPQTQQKQILR